MEVKSDFLDVFGKVFITSGAKGLDGDGYWYDKILNIIPRYSFKGATLILKTVTLNSRDGNLPLKDNLQPKEYFPSCVRVYPFSGAMMNAVGVSNPGIESMFKMNIWQKLEPPILLSIIPVGKTRNDRLQEIYEMMKIISNYMSTFPHPGQVGIQLNVSCPNTGISIDEYIQDLLEYVITLKELNTFIDVKINILVPPEKLENCAFMCDIITCSNTIPYGSFPDKINWSKYKLSKYPNQGGLSGNPIKPFVLNWIKHFKNYYPDYPIKACGGILHKNDVDMYKDVGASAIEIGSVKALRPWRVKSIVERANEIL